MTAPNTVVGFVLARTQDDARLTAQAHGTTLMIGSTDHAIALTLNESAADEFAAEVAEAIATIKGNARVTYIGRASNGETLDTADREVAGQWAFDRAQSNVVVLDQHARKGE